jgi:hypothetical protein
MTYLAQNIISTKRSDNFVDFMNWSGAPVRSGQFRALAPCCYEVFKNFVLSAKTEKISA